MKLGTIVRPRRIVRRVSNAFVPRALVLLYHRVNELPLDPQLLCVSRKNFSAHLEVIRSCGHTMRIKDLDRALKYKNVGRPTIVITFDDGYADNLHFAKPALESHGVPATVFVTSGYIGANREFWSDDLERIFLHDRPLPEILRVKINGQRYQWEIGSFYKGEQVSADLSDWNVARKDSPTMRHVVYRSLHRLLFPLSDPERQRVLEELASWVGLPVTGRATHRTMTSEELIQLGGDGLIEIGSHTMTHPSLSDQPTTAQSDEIRGSKAQLEKILGQRITSFAYPFGGKSHYTKETIRLVKEAGFEWACSNFAGTVRPRTDHWQLPRFLVRNWNRDEFANRLEEWLRA